MTTDLKPCRSPYCECTEGQCTHPGCYDARSEAKPAPVALTPAERRAKILEAYKMLKEANIKAQRMGQLLLQMAAHPEMVPDNLIEAARGYRNTVTTLRDIKKTLHAAALKHNVSYVLAHSINDLKVMP